MENGTVQNQPMVDAAHSEMPRNSYPQAPEGYVTNDKANWLISQAKQAAYEKGMQEAQAKMQANPPAQPGISVEDLESRLDSLVEQKLKTKQDDMFINNMMNTHRQNLASGKQKYGEDFDESVSSINFQALPQLVPLINSLPNADDVMFELGKDENEDRFDKITNLLAKGQFVKAEKAMKTFSSSLAENNGAAKKAKNMPNIPEPLNSVKPSTASAGPSGNPQTYAEISAAIEKMLLTRR